MPARRFPLPWTVEELDGRYVVKDNAGQKLPESHKLGNFGKTNLGALSAALLFELA